MKRSTANVLRYQAPAVLWAVIIFILSSIPSVNLPKFGWLASDKMAHVGVFMVFAGLTCRALRHQQLFPLFSRRAFLFTVLFTAVYGALDELHQYFVPGRDSDPVDWIADVAGSIVLVAAIWMWQKISSPAGPVMKEQNMPGKE
jgi:VanZ family protein